MFTLIAVADTLYEVPASSEPVPRLHAEVEPSPVTVPAARWTG
ncbi:hypothetical protein [Streptomyces sp. NPDC004284]